MRPISGGLNPWADVKEVAATAIRLPGMRGRTPMLGVRLRSYAGYLASLSPREVTLALKSARAARVAAAAMTPAMLSDPQRLLETVFGRDVGKVVPLELLSVPQTSLAVQLAWNHKACGGWDVTFGGLLFDRPLADAAVAVSDYQSAAGY